MEGSQRLGWRCKQEQNSVSLLNLVIELRFVLEGDGEPLKGFR